jgi:hypothetical protein
MARRRNYARVSAQIQPVYVPPASIEVVRHITRRNALDGRLEPTDWHMQRWAQSQGSDLLISDEAADALPRVKLPPLADEDAVITDQIVLHSPDHWRGFVFSWYMSPKPVEVIAKELGCEKRTVYTERRLVLAYLLGRLTEAGVRIASYHGR